MKCCSLIPLYPRMDFRFKKLSLKYRIHMPRLNTWEHRRNKVMSNLIKAIQCSYHANFWLETIFLESMKFIKPREKNVVNITLLQLSFFPVPPDHRACT